MMLTSSEQIGSSDHANLISESVLAADFKTQAFILFLPICPKRGQNYLKVLLPAGALKSAAHMVLMLTTLSNLRGLSTHPLCIWSQELCLKHI
jgi:hypothetical protein